MLITKEQLEHVLHMLYRVTPDDQSTNYPTTTNTNCPGKIRILAFFKSSPISFSFKSNYLKNPISKRLRGLGSLT